jgi:hypothetical protein
VRTYGRFKKNGVLVWAMVVTDANGNNDAVYVTALNQTLKLNLGESPFYSDNGIPAAQSIQQQVFPDYYSTLTQQLYSPQFASLLITRPDDSYPPTYSVAVMTHSGVKIDPSAAVPT